MSIRHRLATLAALLSLVGTTPVAAHTMWLEPVEGVSRQYAVKFGGHAGVVVPYAPAKLKTVEAWDAAGRPVPIERGLARELVTISLGAPAAIVAAHFDNGIHSRGLTGPSVERPMNEVPGATKGTRALKYHKTVLEWSPRATRPIGQPFEVVPVDAATPVGGRPIRVRVLLDGKPLAGVRLGRGEEPGDEAAASGADGIVEFVPTAGFNKLWAGRRFAVAGNPAYTELSHEYLLGFWAR